MRDEMRANWPDCAIVGCTSACCLALDSPFCFPHTLGNEHVKRMKIRAVNVTPDDMLDATANRF